MLDFVNYEPASGKGCVAMWCTYTNPDGKFSYSQITNPMNA